MDNVAVYWDFENIHASVCDAHYGAKWYSNNRFQKQPEMVDIDSLMEYMATLGNININKAYANWGFFFLYSAALQNHAIDLMQLFPRGAHSKNGADIRMAIDIIEDLSQCPHVDTVVVLGGDSDYISVAQKVRQRGRRIVGVGVRESTNQYWIKSCNEFKFYASLMTKASTSQEPETQDEDRVGMDEAKRLLCTAITALSSRTDGGPVLKAAIKPMMTRLNPSFDEANHGFKTFADFLKACGDVVSMTPGQHDHIVTLKNVPSFSSSYMTNGTDNERPYASILRRQNVRLVGLSLLEASVMETWEIFARGERCVLSYAGYKEELRNRLNARNMKTTESDAADVKSLLSRFQAFTSRPDRNGIWLAKTIKSAEDLLSLVRCAIVGCVIDNLYGEPNVQKLSELVYGDISHEAETRILIEKWRSDRASLHLQLTVAANGDDLGEINGNIVGTSKESMENFCRMRF